MITCLTGCLHVSVVVPRVVLESMDLALYTKSLDGSDVKSDLICFTVPSGSSVYIPFGHVPIIVPMVPSRHLKGSKSEGKKEVETPATYIVHYCMCTEVDVTASATLCNHVAAWWNANASYFPNAYQSSADITGWREKLAAAKDAE